MIQTKQDQLVNILRERIYEMVFPCLFSFSRALWSQVTFVSTLKEHHVRVREKIQRENSCITHECTWVQPPGMIPDHRIRRCKP